MRRTLRLSCDRKGCVRWVPFDLGWDLPIGRGKVKADAEMFICLHLTLNTEGKHELTKESSR